MPSKKRRRPERPSIHPRNTYFDNPPDFGLLASIYPSFNPHVFYARDGRPKIDFTDFNATRELTRILLLHDHHLNWWIPDGQLCPTVPNRSNYIHWIEDLLSSELIPKKSSAGSDIRGFDIGTGANCIYPLLGASLLGWSFVGSDVTDVAVEWAERNVESNPRISGLIEIRKVVCAKEKEDLNDGSRGNMILNEHECIQGESKMGENPGYCDPPILVGVVKDEESFDFCMCNPPFFNSIEDAGRNPKTSCGGTADEMVCYGGEEVFIARIIEDSVVLNQSFRWYTSMVGKKANLKTLVSKLRGAGVTIVKTTEFVQGQTCRWGLAWSFVPPVKTIKPPHVFQKSAPSFMLEGLQREFNAVHVLQEVESFFSSSGASCKLNATSFTVDICASKDHCDAILENGASGSNQMDCLHPNLLSFGISVFQQIPGTLLVKGSLHGKEKSIPGAFSLIFQQLEEGLRFKFCRGKKP